MQLPPLMAMPWAELQQQPQTSDQVDLAYWFPLSMLRFQPFKAVATRVQPGATSTWHSIAPVRSSSTRRLAVLSNDSSSQTSTEGQNSHAQASTCSHLAVSPIFHMATLAVVTASTAMLAGTASAQVLDASQVHTIADALRPLLTFITFLYIVRIPMTWYPNLDPKEFPWNLAVGPTEPFLSATRKVIPLVGGVDITPIVWVGLLSFFNEILLGPQGLLVLIERQGGL